jgi:hypothetical protein
VKKFFEENINGILATIAFHLFLFVVFLIIKISTSSSSSQADIVIDFSNMEEVREFLDENKEELSERQGFEELYEQIRASNMASNLDAKFEEQISTEKFVEQVMNENDIDDLNPDFSDDDLFSFDENEIKKTDYNPDKKVNTFKGATSIMYELKNRTGKYLHVPVYKCETGGKVVINIAVNQKGKVVDASINRTLTSDFMTCLEEAGINAAYKSFFNTDYNAEVRQNGTITYIFRPQ